MQSSFALEIVSPFRRLSAVEASEVVLPAHDGEDGVLVGHENVVGLLGTGPLKYVAEGDDYWFVVSNGTYQVLDGTLIILTEIVEDAKEIDPEVARKAVVSLEAELSGADISTPEARQKQEELDRSRARLEVYRRVNEVN